MSVLARGPSVCLSCRAKQALLSRRQLSHAAKRSLDTVQVVIHNQDDAFLADSSKTLPQKDGPSPVSTQSIPRVKLQVTTDELREAHLSFDALIKSRDARVEILRSLSNHADHPSGRQHHVPRSRNMLALNSALLPHDDFKRDLREAVGDKAIRSVLRRQLLRCEVPRDIYKIVAVAMQSRKNASCLARLYEPLIRALYRCRQKVADPVVLSTLNAIIFRFRGVGLPVEYHLYFMALKFAARSRSLPSMKKHLKIIRESGLGLNSNVFRSIIAKCSIGHRGLGEIRNGRWKRSDLRQVLLGFDDAKHLPEDQQYHFGTFLVREDWQYLHGWVAVLARCKETDQVWREWELWKQTEAFKRPRDLLTSDGKAVTNKLRGCYWFLEQLSYSGDMKRAWQIFEETGISFATIKNRIKDRLLAAPEHATIWNDEIREEMLKKYDRDLGQIEQALGVKWVAGETEGEGQHVLFKDQEDVLEDLSSDSWKLNEDYGYPWEETPVLSDGDRDLHDAKEDRSI